jgi:thiol-disulfide isomerase/thioredoxin
MPKSRHHSRRGAALVGAAAIALAACGGDDDSSQNGAPPTDQPAAYASGSTPPGGQTAESAELAAALTEVFTGSTTLAGDEAFDGAQLADGDSVVWFWAPWCTICRAEAPTVAEVAEQFADEVTLIGVPGRGDLDEMREFVEDTGHPARSPMSPTSAVTSGAHSACTDNPRSRSSTTTAPSRCSSAGWAAKPSPSGSPNWSPPDPDDRPTTTPHPEAAGMNGTYAFALAAGMAATVNPCGFALLPAYLAAFVGIEHRGGRAGAVGRALTVSLALTAGFVLVFGAFGLIISPLAVRIEHYLPWATVVIGFGLLGLGMARCSPDAS